VIPLQMLLASLVGWLECEQRDVIAFLREENRAPKAQTNCNAYAEQCVRSIKEEGLNRVIPLGERHLRRTIGNQCGRLGLITFYTVFVIDLASRRVQILACRSPLPKVLFTF
jgi:hypothetical protein